MRIESPANMMSFKMVCIDNTEVYSPKQKQLSDNLQKFLTTNQVGWGLSPSEWLKEQRYNYDLLISPAENENSVDLYFANVKKGFFSRKQKYNNLSFIMECSDDKPFNFNFMKKNYIRACNQRSSLNLELFAMIMVGLLEAGCIYLFLSGSHEDKKIESSATKQTKKEVIDTLNNNQIAQPYDEK